MASVNQNIQKLNPDMRDLFDDLKKEIFLGLNCHAIANVVEVNYQQQTLTAQINYKKMNIVKDDGARYIPKQTDYPPLLDCPFMVVSGGLAGITFPIKPGDECLIFFNDRCLDDWWDSGQVATISIPRLHSVSDAIAMVGISSKQNAIVSDPDKMVIFNDETKITLGPKVKVNNAAQNLGTVLQELITKINQLATQVAAITVSYVDDGNPAVSGPPVNAAAIMSTANDITTIGVDLGGLLE